MYYLLQRPPSVFLLFRANYHGSTFSKWQVCGLLMCFLIDPWVLLIMKRIWSGEDGGKWWGFPEVYNPWNWNDKWCGWYVVIFVVRECYFSIMRVDKYKHTKLCNRKWWVLSPSTSTKNNFLLVSFIKIVPYKKELWYQQNDFGKTN